jgi:hypothetical protein
MGMIRCPQCDSEIATEEEVKHGNVSITKFDIDCDCGAVIKGKITTKLGKKNWATE